MAAVSNDAKLRNRLTDEQRSLGGFWARLSGLRKDSDRYNFANWRDGPGP